MLIQFKLLQNTSVSESVYHLFEGLSLKKLKLLHENIDQTLMNLLQSPLKFEMGGLDYRLITTEYVSRVIE